VKIRYQYGANPSNAGPVYDDTAPGGDTLGRPLAPTIGAISVGISFSDSVAQSASGADSVQAVLAGAAGITESAAFQETAAWLGSQYSVSVGESDALLASANGVIPVAAVIDPNFLVRARPRLRTITPG